MISDSLNDFHIHNDRFKSDQVGDKEANSMAFVDNVVSRLLPKRHLLQLKFDNERVLIRLFQQPMSKRIQHFDSATDNPKYSCLSMTFSASACIRVHSCEFVVSHETCSTSRR